MARTILLSAAALLLGWPNSHALGITIPEAKLLGDRATVSIPARCVTLSAPGYFYIQEASGSAGIRVVSPPGASRWSTVTVSGKMGTNNQGERQIEATSVTVVPESGCPDPVQVQQSYLGGSSWHYNKENGAGQRGVPGSRGLNNVGLLVKVSGKLTGASSSGLIAYIDDGSGVDDGNSYGPGGTTAPGVRLVLATGSVPPPPGTYVSATGVCSLGLVPRANTIFAQVLLPDAASLEWKAGPPSGHPGDMELLAAGGFQMGSSGAGDDLAYGAADESPQHYVYLSPYWIGTCEVTRDDYQKFISAGGYDREELWTYVGWRWRQLNSRTEPAFWAASQNWGSPPGAFLQTGKHPVVGVTYYEAQAFANWAGGALPSEAQWEKAARWDGHPRIYPWGDAFDSSRCNNWYDNTWAYSQTEPAASYPLGVSPAGCYDMAGNVSEWCRDYYDSAYYQTVPEDGWIDPPGPALGTLRTVRGGDWTYASWYYRLLRCADRNPAPQDLSYNQVGFRVAYYPERLDPWAEVEGETFPEPGQTYDYTFDGLYSNLGHNVEFLFDWGDGTQSQWNTGGMGSHAWTAQGPHTIVVTSRCRLHPDVTASCSTTVWVQAHLLYPDLVTVPAGQFTMGNTSHNDDYTALSHGEAYDELPEHVVQLSAYQIGRSEVTRGQYRLFIESGGYQNQQWWSQAGWEWRNSVGRMQPDYWVEAQNWGDPPGVFTQTDAHPVVGVSWYEAEAFCNWAGGRLPTEAEWEKTARANGLTSYIYPWGYWFDHWQAEQCNSFEDLSYVGYQTAPVGSYTAGSLGGDPGDVSNTGVRDMAGNAAEWCSDWYDEDYYYPEPPGGWVDPAGPASGTKRSLRGGSWGQANSYYYYPFRCAARKAAPPDLCTAAIGFRLVK